jgi:cysteine desulfurase
VWRSRRESGRNAAVATPIEHKAILGALHEVAHEGGEERLLRVRPNGLVDDASFDALVNDAAAVCSVMWVNNEIGVMQAVPSLARRAHERGVIFHTDAVQAFGKVEIDAKATPFDLLSISGHKIGAPKGIGALFIRRGTPMSPLMFGGSQDRGRRPGTENVAMAVGLARAAELTVAERVEECRRLDALRDRLEAALLQHIPDAVIHGRGAPRAPHVISISVPGTDSESLLMALDLRGVACSAGSACQSGSITPSHVLTALGVPADLASAAIRMSLGSLTTDDGIARVAELFPALVEKARRLATA